MESGVWSTLLGSNADYVRLDRRNERNCAKELELKGKRWRKRMCEPIFLNTRKNASWATLKGNCDFERLIQFQIAEIRQIFFYADCALPLAFPILLRHLEFMDFW